MSFDGNGTRFVGDDGYLQTASFGAEVIGDAATPLPAGTYVIIKVATVSAFPGAALVGGTDPAVGDMLIVDPLVVITPAVGDDVVTLTVTDKCDVASWAMAFTKSEIDVSSLCDTTKVYRMGRADMQGTMNGIFIAGTTDDTDGFMREYIRIIKQDGSTSMDSFAQIENILIGKFYVNNDTNLADKMFVSCAFQLAGFNLGGEIGSPQSFSANFRFANLAYTSAADVEVSVVPTFHRIGG